MPISHHQLIPRPKQPEITEFCVILAGYSIPCPLWKF